MNDLFWKLKAELSRTIIFDGLGGWPFSMGDDIAKGTVAEMLDKYLEFPEEERSRMMITTASGFRLEGEEIDALVARRRREMPPSEG
ncbi:hypothetical protein [Sphingomonas sp. NFR04]|uniref:hypothetical protein n=1 Tax=Sphingomonas sp. NFR04 TaxID=1566283 RepID=UPI00158754B8|nr:hypothetical protein [Sphingomonas sp. NFR04]